MMQDISHGREPYKLEEYSENQHNNDIKKLDVSASPYQNGSSKNIIKQHVSSLHGVYRLESDHSGAADRWVSRRLRQLCFILPPTSFFHCTIGGGDVCGSASRIDQAMDVLRTDHSTVNGVEWYAQTLSDALQTQCAVLRFAM
ncbi:hypothetical protein TNCV_4817751 [Trichonephila clavipes]|nr:hypothetical protein TNCV_4817751 [Trichonephila clavipes]